MEKLDSSILIKELHVESFLKKREVEIHSFKNLSENWENHFFKVSDMTDEALEEYLKQERFYIEGSLCIWSYGREILSFKEWDLVDQLWAYFINALHELIVCGDAKSQFSFPDQPLPVVLEKKKRNIVLSINNKEVVQIGQPTFCTIFLKEGIQFLNRLKKASKSASYNEAITQAEEILNTFKS